MLELLYEGKAKQIFKTDDATQVLIYYKDDLTAFNGIKKAQVANKGIYNNAITTRLFQLLEVNGIKTHFIQKVDDRHQLCKKVDIIPLEVILRNTLTGSIVKKLDLEEGMSLTDPIIELCYKNDALADPLINDAHALVLKACTREELQEIKAITRKINAILQPFFEAKKLRLVDFKLEFGRDEDGTILLADEISPDTCRFWDLETNEKLDKDRYRQDLGNTGAAYLEIKNRIGA